MIAAILAWFNVKTNFCAGSPGRKEHYGPELMQGLYLCAMEHDEARHRMREALNKVHEWPSVYMFKFILEPDEHRLNAVLALFPPEAEVLRKYSQAGKYLGITVKEVMLSADEVVARYDQVAKIEGVIVL
jgi:putative lipoic acid-binding regulatory protein